MHLCVVDPFHFRSFPNVTLRALQPGPDCFRFCHSARTSFGQSALSRNLVHLLMCPDRTKSSALSIDACLVLTHHKYNETDTHTDTYTHTHLHTHTHTPHTLTQARLPSRFPFLHLASQIHRRLVLHHLVWQGLEHQRLVLHHLVWQGPEDWSFDPFKIKKKQ